MKVRARKPAVPEPVKTTARQRLADEDAERSRLRREARAQYISASVPDERYDALVVAAAGEEALEVVEDGLRDHVAEKRAEAEHLERRALELDEQAAQAAVDPHRLEHLHRVSEKRAAQGDALAGKVGRAIIDLKAEEQIKRIEALAAGKFAEAAEAEREIEVLQRRQAEAERLQAEARDTRARAEALRRDADDDEAAIPTFLAERAPGYAIAARNELKHKRELQARSNPKPAFDSASEVQRPVQLITDSDGRLVTVELP